jgi:hypothetical protein
MTDDLAAARLRRKAAEIIADPDHLGHRRLVDELQSWIEMDDALDADDCPPHGIARPSA